MPSIAPPHHTRKKGHSTDSWITPEWLIDRLGPFDLDPCACIPMPWKTADVMLTELEDGLLSLWSGFVYCNPPYGKALGPWLNRMALHDNGIALVFARVDTQAFFKNVWPFASTLLFLEGRLSFFRPDGTAPEEGHNSGGPSVLIGYGPKADSVLLRERKLGALVKPQRL